MYADSSALVKLFLREPESAALASYIPPGAVLVSSALARVEVTRTVRVAGLEDEVEGGLDGMLDGVGLVDIDRTILGRAAALANASLRSLDAIHLATAMAVGPDAVLAYDRGLCRAARTVGLHVESPGVRPE